MGIGTYYIYDGPRRDGSTSMKKNRAVRGITLIEALVTLAIVGLILAAVVSLFSKNFTSFRCGLVYTLSWGVSDGSMMMFSSISVFVFVYRAY